MPRRRHMGVKHSQKPLTPSKVPHQDLSQYYETHASQTRSCASMIGTVRSKGVHARPGIAEPSILFYFCCGMQVILMAEACLGGCKRLLIERDPLLQCSRSSCTVLECESDSEQISTRNRHARTKLNGEIFRYPEISFCHRHHQQNFCAWFRVAFTLYYHCARQWRVPLDKVVIIACMRPRRTSTFPCRLQQSVPHHINTH